MDIFKKKNIKLFSALIFILIIFILCFIYINKIQGDKDEVKSFQPISINLLTSVHPSLKWSFTPIKNKVMIFNSPYSWILFFLLYKVNVKVPPLRRSGCK